MDTEKISGNNLEVNYSQKLVVWPQHLHSPVTGFMGLDDLGAVSAPIGRIDL